MRDRSRKAEAGEDWLRRLAGYCWRFRGEMLLALGGSLLATVVTAAIPLIQRDIVDNAILAHRQPIWPGATALIIAAVLTFTGVHLRRYLGGRLSLDVQHHLRTELFGSLQRLDGARQDQLHTGQIVSRSISDLNMVQGLLGMVPMMLGSVVLFFLSLGVMLVLSPLLTVIGLAVGPALWFIALASRRRLFPSSWDAQQQAGEVAAVVDGAIAGVRVVKGFGQEDQEVSRLESASRSLFAKRLRTVRLTARYNPALQAIPALGQVGVLALGGWLVIRGQITIGTFLAFASYLVQLVAPVRMLAGLVTIGQEARASVIRVFEVIDSRPVLTEKSDAVELRLARPDGADGGLAVSPAIDRAVSPAIDQAVIPAIELDNVHFGYVPSQPVLNGLSLAVKPGETLAVVGTSGSGKSTISLLLPRFYDVRSGSVRVGGRDVRDVTLASLRSSIGLVMEESFLFSDTVRANIGYGRPDATSQQIQAAARAAEADEFISSLPDGYDTVIGEQGLTLSGGQRQRVALARALLTDPAILVLDDATSAVDARVEAQIHATLRRVMAGRTTLLIAHRRSTLSLAQRIAVLDSGRLIDAGTHDELMTRCPLYRLLLAGPGEDAEGIDAGELSFYENEMTPATPRASEQPAGRGVSGAAGAGAGTPAGRAHAGTAVVNAGMGGALRGSAGGGFLSGIPASPELLAKVDALPPANDEPAVSLRFAKAPDPAFRLARLLRPFAIGLVLGLVLDGLDALAGVAMPWLVRGGIDHGVETGSLRIVLLIAVAALAIVVADFGVNSAQTVVVGRNGERILYTLRVKIFSHLQRLGLDYYERELSGRIMTRMTTDVDAMSTFLQTGLITMVNSVLTFFGVLAALLLINIRLGLTVMTILPVLIVATVVFRAKSRLAYAEAREKVSLVNADFSENVAGLRVAQAYRREAVNARRFAGLSRDYRHTRLRAQRYIALYFPFVQALSTIAGALVLFVAAGEVRAGALTAGGLVAYMLYVDSLFSPIQQLSQVFDGYQQAAVGLRRIGDLLRTPTSTPPPEIPVWPTRPATSNDGVSRAGPAQPGVRPGAPSPLPRGDGQERLRGEIELRKIRFRYTGQHADAIAGVSLHLAPGETVALVGPTGAGKSTLVKLIARFYDVTSGAVLIDGMDVRSLDLGAYRRQLGVVPQEPYLFPGTIRDAIVYGRPGAPDSEVLAAVRAVGAADVIARLPGGLSHEVSERGRNLSAGQRQLISLARAYLVDPAILLLDEATAALDLAAEAAVTRAVELLTSRRTTIVVAHRLSTAARADRIAVVQDGRITETGSHDELLAADGAYADMWKVFTGETQLVG